jgi:hypothetical protein
LRIGDQLAQERNHYDERNTDRETIGAKRREELRQANSSVPINS